METLLEALFVPRCFSPFFFLFDAPFFLYFFHIVSVYCDSTFKIFFSMSRCQSRNLFSKVAITRYGIYRSISRNKAGFDYSKIMHLSSKMLQLATTRKGVRLYFTCMPSIGQNARDLSANYSSPLSSGVYMLAPFLQNLYPRMIVYGKIMHISTTGIHATY